MNAVEPVMQVLQDTFGFSEFRPNQEVLVKALIEGKDVFGVMPTGGGKSLCYQLPAVLLDGCAVVVSPLIALMKDQVDSAVANGIRAEFLNSTLSSQQVSEIEQQYRDGKLDMLYVAPERLTSYGFVDFLRQSPLGKPSFFAIDEAHCISEWGHDFRPDYMFLTQLKALFLGVPVAAFTATATPKVAEDIEQKLTLHSAVKVRASFDRVNLFYEVRAKRDWQTQLVEYVKKRSGESGIIYRTTRKSVEQTAELLRANGVSVQAYHAGMEPAVRASAQEAFIRDNCDVIVATIAFGMGIDKADVRFVVHVDLPKNIEGYYQETGRAGRDGESSSCLMLHGSGDVVKLSRFIDDVVDEEERNRSRALLRAMDRFGAVPQCRRKALLEYFGEPYPKDNCGGCDFCTGEFKAEDVTRDAQILLSAVARTKGKFGAVQVCDIVVGANTAKIRQFDHDKLKTYGAGKDKPKTHWRRLLDALISASHLQLSTDQYPVPQITQIGWDVMMGKGTFSMHVDQRVEPEKASASAAADDGPFHHGLFDHLRMIRKEVADLEEVPPYVVFADRTLKQMAATMPEKITELQQLHGVGTAKLDKYGETFVRAITSYLEMHPESRAERVPLAEMRKRVAATKSNSSGVKKVRGETFLKTLELLRKGSSVESIAQQRELSVSTIEGHLVKLWQDGDIDLNIRDYVSEEQEKLCRELIETHGSDALKPIVEASNGKLTYTMIKLVMAGE